MAILNKRGTKRQEARKIANEIGQAGYDYIANPETGTYQLVRSGGEQYKGALGGVEEGSGLFSKNRRLKRMVGEELAHQYYTRPNAASGGNQATGGTTTTGGTVGGAQGSQVGGAQGGGTEPKAGGKTGEFQLSKEEQDAAIAKALAMLSSSENLPLPDMSNNNEVLKKMLEGTSYVDGQKFKPGENTSQAELEAYVKQLRKEVGDDGMEEFMYSLYQTPGKVANTIVNTARLPFVPFDKNTSFGDWANEYKYTWMPATRGLQGEREYLEDMLDNRTWGGVARQTGKTLLDIGSLTAPATGARKVAGSTIVNKAAGYTPWATSRGSQLASGVFEQPANTVLKQWVPEFTNGRYMFNQYTKPASQIAKEAYTKLPQVVQQIGARYPWLQDMGSAARGLVPKIIK